MFVNVVSVNDVSGPPSGVGPASWFGIRINHTWSDVKSPVYLISLVRFVLEKTKFNKCDWPIAQVINFSHRMSLTNIRGWVRVKTDFKTAILNSLNFV